jgi:hypothetical protein
MGKIRIAITALIIAMLFVSAIVETAFYYNNKISNLNSQISKLNDIIANFPTAHLVDSLGITEKLGNESGSIPYNYLYMIGSVTNTGKGTAYNAGLLVVAYNSTGTLEINMTVPLCIGLFATNAYILKNFGGNSWATRTLVLYGEQTDTYIVITIYHEGIVSNWTVKPVWTNSP